MTVNEWDNLISTAYSLGLEGAVYCERRRWEDGIKALTNARSIYSKLQQSPKSKSSRNEHYLQVSIDELDPLIKYCAYQLKLKTGTQVDIQELLDMKRFIGKQNDLDCVGSQLDVGSNLNL